MEFAEFSTLQEVLVLHVGRRFRNVQTIFQDADMVLPTEVPGLDDAADAWYDLEGIEPPVEEEKRLHLRFLSALVVNR